MIKKIITTFEKRRYFMRFSEIPSNHHVKRQLVTAATNGRLSHAHLFVGEEGSASLALVLHLPNT